MLQTILIILLALVLFILGILLLRTARFPMRAGFEEPLAGDPTPDADGERVAAHLGRAVQLASVSNLDDPNPPGKQAILSLHALLETLYPRVHATLNKEVIAGYSLLYTWEGAQAGLPPALFIAHLDGVPADEAYRGRLPAWMRRDGVFTALYILLFCLERFSLDFLRADHWPVWAGPGQLQMLMLAGLAGAAVMIAYGLWKPAQPAQ